MKNTTITITIIALLIISGCATQTSMIAPEVKPLVFGVVAPMTGASAFYGAYARAGINLAIEDINKAGGVDGRPVKIIYEDAGDKTIATTSAKKLIESDGVDALFAMLTPMAGAVAPVAEEAGVPTIYWSPSTSFADGKKFVFQDFYNAGDTCALLMKQAQDSGKSRVAIFGTQCEFTQLCKQGAEKVFPLVAYESYNSGESDFKTQFTKLEQSQTQAIILSMFAPDCKNAFKQVRELGINASLYIPYGGTSCGSSDNTKANLDLLDGTYSAGWDIDEYSADPAFLDFKSRIDANGGTTQLAGSVVVYGSMKAMANSYKGCKDKTCAAENLRNLHEFPVVTGPLSYDGKQTVSRGVMLAKLENGKWKKVK